MVGVLVTSLCLLVPSLGTACIGMLYIPGSRPGPNGLEYHLTSTSLEIWAWRKSLSSLILGGLSELSKTDGHSSGWVFTKGQKPSCKPVMTEWMNGCFEWSDTRDLKMSILMEVVTSKREGLSSIKLHKVEDEAMGPQFQSRGQCDYILTYHLPILLCAWNTVLKLYSHVDPRSGTRISDAVLDNPSGHNSAQICIFHPTPDRCPDSIYDKDHPFLQLCLSNSLFHRYQMWMQQNWNQCQRRWGRSFKGV